jgi:hypothetical protein
VRYGVTGQPSKVLKTDDSGNLLGEFTLSTSNVNPGVVGDCVVSDGSGSYYIGGQTINSTTGKYAFYICKTSDNAPIWYNEYDFGRNSAFLYDIDLLADGNIVVTGRIADEDLTSVSNMAVLKVDPGSGSVLWAKEIKQSGEFNHIGYFLLPLENNEMIVCGQAHTMNGVQACAAMLHADGSVVWAREYGEGIYGSFWLGFEVEADRYLFSGQAALNEGPYIVQTDGNGFSPCYTEIMDFTSYDVTPTIYSQNIITADPDVEVVVLPYNENPLSLTGTVLCSGTLSLQELPGQSPFTIYPNPARDQLTVKLNQRPETSFTVSIYNIQGILVGNTVMQGPEQTLEIHYSPGLYFIAIYNSENRVVHHEEIVIN